MAHSAKILLDSISKHGHRITTFEVTIPRIVLAEWNTHRDFSRSSASSRAIPVKKMIEMVMTDPYIPSTWGKNQKGMSAAEEFLGEEAVSCQTEWLHARDNAVYQAQKLLNIGVHKQLTNRLLEPFMWHTIINTATEYGNFFGLRDDPHAHPDIQVPARNMRILMECSTPRLLREDQWHLPLTTGEEWVIAHENSGDLNRLIKVCVGRCARVSYLTHDGRRDLEADVRLHDDLLGNGHMSPFEHAARPMTNDEYWIFCQRQSHWEENNKVCVHTIKEGAYIYTHYLGNVQGWIQYRKMIPNERDYGNYLKAQAQKIDMYD
jgi:thymidylate synthase ThyX